ncbi:MAG: hypothetical protein QW265_00600 [Candidatus Bathyarchaeia archaeon]
MSLAKILAAFSILLILFPSFRINSAEILINLDENYTSVNILSNLNQNLTNFIELDEKVIDLQHTQAKESLQKALKELSPNASVENLLIMISSNGKAFSVNINFDLKGIVSKEGNVLGIDLKWKSFKIKDDLKFKDIHYNLIGKHHLKPLLENWRNDTSFSFYLNGSGPTDPSLALEEVEKLSLIDFTVLKVPLSSWNFIYDIESHKTSWSFTSKPLIDLTVYKRDLNFTKSYYVFMNVSATVKCSGFGKAVDDTIKINTGKGDYEMIMLSIILVFISFAVLINRRIRGLSKSKKFKA